MCLCIFLSHHPIYLYFFYLFLSVERNFWCFPAVTETNGFQSEYQRRLATVITSTKVLACSQKKLPVYLACSIIRISFSRMQMVFSNCGYSKTRASLLYCAIIYCALRLWLVLKKTSCLSCSVILSQLLRTWERAKALAVIYADGYRCWRPKFPGGDTG